MSMPIQSIKPQNAFYQNLALIERRQDALVARVEAIGASLPAPGAVGDAIAGLAVPVGELGYVIARSGADQAGATNRTAAATEDAAGALNRLANAHQRLVRLVEIERNPEQRVAVSHLFLGVNVDGSFTRSSVIGELLIAASGGATGLAMELPSKTETPSRKKRVPRGEFVETGVRYAQASGFAELTAEDFGEFYDQAPHVLKAIDQDAARRASLMAD